MKKSNLYIVLGILILLIVLLVVYLANKQEKPFNQVQLDLQKNSIINLTSYDYYDTIVHVGLKEMGFEGIDLQISALSDNAIQNFQANGGDLYAHLRESNGKFYLFIRPSSKEQSITIISHELIHLEQYLTKRLVYNNGLVTWDGKVYGVDEVSYNLRPWEDEAFQRETELSNKISQILY